MIGTINVEIQAASPNMPLCPVFVFRDSFQLISVAGVPDKIGDWNIEKVWIQVEFPDNTGKTFSCIESRWNQKKTLWTTIVSASSTVGSTSNGFTVVGQDKDGNQYILGKGDFHVLDSDWIVKPGEQKWTMRLVEAKSDNPSRGDVFLDDCGSLHVYDGEEWREVATEEYVESQVSSKQDALPVVSGQAGTYDIKVISANASISAVHADSANYVPWSGVENKKTASTSELGLVKVG